MVIRFPFRPEVAGQSGAADSEPRVDPHHGLDRAELRRLSTREIAHRERMLRHLEQAARAAQ